MKQRFVFLSGEVRLAAPWLICDDKVPPLGGYRRLFGRNFRFNGTEFVEYSDKVLKDYECHVTVEACLGRDRQILELMGQEKGWKTSFVTGDPDLGQGSRFFFTTHFSRMYLAWHSTNALAVALELALYKVVRRKIELVVADTRAGTWP